MLSTEGAISSFFTRLSQSSLANHYMEASFYHRFLLDTTAQPIYPERIFSPIQNMFLKYFVIFHEYMSQPNLSRSELINFIEGYITTFPSEEKEIKKIFKEVTMLDYKVDLPPDVWLSIKNYNHRFLLIDPYGSLTLPVYTFDLNAAETEDLITLKGITREEASKIIEFRKKKGFFTSIDQIKNIKGISNNTINLILSSAYDHEHIQSLNMPNLNFKSLLNATLKQLIARSLAYFMFISTLIYVLFLRKKEYSFKKVMGILFMYLPQWVLFVIAGLLFTLITIQEWQFLLILILLFVLGAVFIHRKNKLKLKRSIVVSGLMGAVILISIL